MEIKTIKLFCILLLTMCLLSSCSKDDLVIPIEMEEILPTEEEDEYMPTATEQYFLDVALNAEFGNQNNKLTKWDSDLLIFVDHNAETELLDELDRIIEEINSLSQSIKMRLIDDRESANYIILFGTADEYATLEPNASSYVDGNWGLTWIYWNSNSIINRGSMYIDVVRNTDLDCQKHLLREEFTQGLGLLNDTFDFPESIFYQAWTCTTEYSPEDRMLITYLLDPNFEANMSIAEILDIFSMN